MWDTSTLKLSMWGATISGVFVAFVIQLHFEGDIVIFDYIEFSLPILFISDRSRQRRKARTASYWTDLDHSIIR